MIHGTRYHQHSGLFNKDPLNKKRYKGKGGGSIVIPAPVAPPAPKFYASDGTVFDDATSMNNYENKQRDDKFQTDLSTAVGQAQNYGRTRISERGLNPDDYFNLLDAEIGRIKTTIPNRDPAPGSYFSDNLADVVLDRRRDQQRNDYRKQVDSYAGPNFSNNMIGDTFDDDIINKIYEEQYGGALDTVLRSKARGTLSDSGFNYGTKQLDTMGQTVKSNLQSLGGNVLGNYRKELDALAGKAYDDAASFDLGETFDPMQYKGQIDSKFGDLKGRLEGDLRSTFGDNLFDVSSVISKAGRNQGSTSGGNIMDVLAAREKKKDVERGLGSQGSF